MLNLLYTLAIPSETFAALNLATIIFDPLEQFETTDVLTFGHLHVINNLGLIMLMNLILMVMVFASYDLNLTNNYDFATRSIYQLVQSMVKENLYIRKQQYFAVLFYLFMTLLFANLIGLLPYSFTITSSFIVTLFISLLHFIGVNAIGASQHG